MLHACVLAGGRGERFWPLSRRMRPKQLTDLTGGGTLLRLTVERLSELVPPERVLVVTSAALVPAVTREVPMVPERQIIGEPVGRNSAPAIALAAAWFARRDPKSVFLVAPSDHTIDGPSFLPFLAEAADYARSADDLVTFGIRPTRPETGYGYIEQGDRIRGNVYRVNAFREKPDPVTAEGLLRRGGFLWNSGMFVWRSEVILEALRACEASILDALGSLRFGGAGEVTRASLESFYAACPSISIDYAVMERASNIAVLRSEFAWCDLGSWAALGEVLPRDADGNVRVGESIVLDSRDSVFYTDGAPIAALGIDGLVVVRLGDVTMVCPKSRAEEVRLLVRELANHERWRELL